MPRLKNIYNKEIVAKLMSKLSLKNKHDVPKLEKIILNMGLGEDASDSKNLRLCRWFNIDSWTKPVIIKFKKSISNLKLEKEQMQVQK